MDKTHKNKKRFSILKRMVIIFGVLIVTVFMLISIAVMNRSRAVLMEKVKAHLIDKAKDTADLINERMKNHFTFMEGIARIPELHGQSFTMREKAVLLKKEAGKTPWIKNLQIVDLQGTVTIRTVWRRTFLPLIGSKSEKKLKEVRSTVNRFFPMQ